jgi:predicted NBD/HSP70 family sugar kinase
MSRDLSVSRRTTSPDETAPASPAIAPLVGALSSGWLLQLIRHRGGATRAQLQAATGMSRTTLTERLDQLSAAGLVREAGRTGPTGGRPATIIEFNAQDKVVLTVDLGHTHARVGAVSLAGEPLVTRDVAVRVLADPAPILADVVSTANTLLAELGEPRVVGVGMAVPAPVATDGVTSWSTSPMSGWSDHIVGVTVGRRWPVPLLLENDARALAVGEDSLRPAQGNGTDILLALKIASGIGAGVVFDGQPLRGSGGAAGDIGHTSVSPDGPRCRCGRRGCLAAYASGRALLRRLRHRRVRNLPELVRLLDAGDAEVVEAVREASIAVGQVVAGVVSAVNPRTLVLGGILGHHPLVVRTVRAEVNRRVIARVVRSMTVEPARLGELAGTVGMGRLVVHRLFDPQQIDRMLSSTTDGLRSSRPREVARAT